MNKHEGQAGTVPITVLCAFNQAYAPFAAACILSIADNHRSGGSIDLHIIALKVSAETRSRLLSRCGRLGIRAYWHDVSAPTPDSVAEWGSESMSPHYLRLQLEKILPPQVHRCIYLDVDTILLDDIEALWDQPLSGKVVGACVDYLPTIADGVSNFAELGLPPGDKYFNSGMMLVDVERWRRRRVSQAVLSCTRANRAHLEAMGRFHQYDQYALNVVLHGEWVELDRRWNHGSELEAPRRPAMVHFNGHGKPWSTTCIPEFRDLFYEYLKQAGHSPAEFPGQAQPTSATCSPPSSSLSRSTASSRFVP